MTFLSHVLLGPYSDTLSIVGKTSILLMLYWYSYWQDPADAAFSAYIPCECNRSVSPTTCTFLSCFFLWFYLLFCTSWDSQYHNQCRLFSIPQDTNYKEAERFWNTGWEWGISRQCKYTKGSICVLQNWEQVSVVSISVIMRKLLRDCEHDRNRNRSKIRIHPMKTVWKIVGNINL